MKLTILTNILKIVVPILGMIAADIESIIKDATDNDPAKQKAKDLLADGEKLMHDIGTAL